VHFLVMRAALASMALLLSLTALAGCASHSPQKAPGQDFSNLGLQATATTGVLRGVVVDQAIRPVAGVAIALSGPATANGTTDAQGVFGFDGLQPGTYFVHASKAGFVPAQSSADVVAGVAQPAAVKILLNADKSTAPYVATYAFDGYIECSFSLVAVGFAACSEESSLNDRFIVNYTLDKPPQWVQSEMSWESTQAANPALDVVYSYQGNTTLLTNWKEDRGPSPLLLQANETDSAKAGLGTSNDLLIRVFNEPINGTRPSDPVGGDDCVDRPQLGGCLTGVGATIEQSFTIITNVFYGVVPDPSWRYVQDGPYQVPA
jgi:hypothetical protein